MSRIVLAAIGLLLANTAVVAETPDIEPGLWRYVNTTVMEGGAIDRQEQENSHQQCVTESDLEDPDFMLEDVENCEISNRSLSASGMEYTMRCEEQSGMVVTMDGDIDFFGDRMEGRMTGKMVSPMGEMDMDVTMEAERIGECPAEEE